MSSTVSLEVSPGLGYLHANRKFPALSPEKDMALARGWREREDGEATRHLVTGHQRLVTGIAHGYRGYGRPHELLPIRDRVLRALEQAAMTEDEAERRRLATFVVIGAGRNGVSLAGRIAELLRDRAEAVGTPDLEVRHVVLVGAEIRVLPGFRRSLSAVARDALKRLGVELRLGVAVSEADAEGVVLAGKRIPTATVLWARDENARAEKTGFAIISRGMAVGEFWPFAFSGGFAWLLWRVVELWSESATRARIAAVLYRSRLGLTLRRAQAHLPSSCVGFPHVQCFRIPPAASFPSRRFTEIGHEQSCSTRKPARFVPLRARHTQVSDPHGRGRADARAPMAQGARSSSCAAAS